MDQKLQADPAQHQQSDLIQRARQRDHEAFTALIQRDMYVIRSVIAIYLHKIRDYEMEDIAQIVIVKAWKGISNFRDGERLFKIWLNKIAHGTCCSILRKQKRRPLEIVNGSPKGSFHPDPITKLFIRELIDALPQPFKTPVSLHIHSGLSYAEIAETLGIPIGTVESRIYRGKQKIKEMVVLDKKVQISECTTKNFQGDDDV